LSFFLRDAVDSLIILAIVFVSSFLGFWQEKGAADAMGKLLSIVQTKIADFFKSHHNAAYIFTAEVMKREFLSV
jgi:magnesium-transporting ATPase (P-type)